MNSQYEREAAPFEAPIKLPARPPRRMDLFERNPAADPLPAVSSTAETAPELIRPALCVQAREGRLHVFLPYAPKLADYLDLVAAVEDTCQYLHQPVWIEGYAPPSDPRLRSFSVTPDPGVLEVNLPPASNWDELEQINTLLFEEARRNRLTAEKFAYDGSHIATGGGNHIVIGGATLLDSPFLRRPDLLRSMLAFWQNHPSLSYLFSGMYVGPTSQYPRVDEARMDALYELELAFSNLPSRDCPPTTVDGLFRNLLVDVTGNSHRAEFCVDKLYPPEGLGLRLGLLELRAFEMAPHVRMDLIEMLLIRALVCMFWKRPFEGGLIRWGTALHDRFMLPHFVRRDFSGVLGCLRQSGYNFEEEWFAAQLEFRFPKIGSIAADGVELELREALEPWNVLAEETTSGRTVRAVDSSFERIQVKVSGLTTESRYVVACNGRSVPLHPTGEPGEIVAGVRYRARQLSAELHPTIPVHAPLIFDIIDCWKERSIGRCAYHVGSPDGRAYTARPVNATEAGDRRRQRFQESDPAPGRMAAPDEETNPIFPMTLDLRCAPPGQDDQYREAGACPMTVDLYQTSASLRRCLRRVVGRWRDSPRPHWAHLMESLRAIGPEELGRRWARAERRIRENGITYNVYGDPLGANRPWQIDIVPLLIPADEWRFIEAGIIQRAQLLNLLLEDLYGAQNLVAQWPLSRRTSLCQPRISATAGGRAGCRRTAICICWRSILPVRPTANGGCWPIARKRLRAAAMRWRTAPSSPMFCLISSARRMYCALPHFSARNAKRSRNLAQRDNPRIVLLTPGPLNETYFEHSYIARYLGFTLVQGADLTVRKRRVYLKTVDGLEKVDVILRRVDDSFCDPLELRADSLLGVPGLVDAIVAGNVKVANALGSGLIETAAIMPFLPGLSAQLLGEKLKLPSVATWWCGQKYALDWVLDHLDQVVVKPAFPSRGMEPVFGAELLNAEKGRFAEQLRARPQRVCSAGAGRFVHGAGVGQRMSQLAQRRAAHLRAQYRQRVDRDSGRTRTRCRSGGVGCLDAARRPQQGRLGPVGQPRRYRSVCCARGMSRSSCTVSRELCRAVSPTMPFGWADMSNAPKTLLGSYEP